MDVGAITRFLHCMRWMWVQLLGFYIVCDGCGCNYYVFALYAMDVGAITMRWMWVQLLRFSLYVMDFNYYVFTLYAMDVGAITRFLHCMRWMWVQLLGFYIVCDGCGCNY